MMPMTISILEFTGWLFGLVWMILWLIALQQRDRLEAENKHLRSRLYDRAPVVMERRDDPRD